MSSISGLEAGAGRYSSHMMPMHRPQRASASDMATAVMSAADGGKGYLEQADVAQTFSVLTRGKSDLSEEQAAEMFSAMDADGDGQVTEAELTSSLEKMEAALAQLFQQTEYAQGAHAARGMGMPPPLAEEDTGFSAEELQAQLNEIEASGDTSESARAELISQVLANFDEADTNGDGKVSFAEARAYEASQSSAEAAAVAAQQSEVVPGASDDTSAAMRQAALLLETYFGLGDDSTRSRLSVRA